MKAGENRPETASLNPKTNTKGVAAEHSGIDILADKGLGRLTFSGLLESVVLALRPPVDLINVIQVEKISPMDHEIQKKWGNARPYRSWLRWYPAKNIPKLNVELSAILEEIGGNLCIRASAGYYLITVLENRQKPWNYCTTIVPRLRVSKNASPKEIGKEDSYERNLSGVPFVLNLQFFRTSVKF